MKKIKIGFSESSKSVTAHVEISIKGESLKGSDIINEAKELYKEAEVFSKMKSFEKLK